MAKISCRLNIYVDQIDGSPDHQSILQVKPVNLIVTHELMLIKQSSMWIESLVQSELPISSHAMGCQCCLLKMRIITSSELQSLAKFEINLRGMRHDF